MASGYTNSGISLRRIGTTVYAKGYVASNSGNIPTSTTTVATLPAQFTPLEFSLFIVEGGSTLRISGTSLQVIASGSRTTMYISGSVWSTA